MVDFINTPGNEVPPNTVLVVPHNVGSDGHYKDIIVPLVGKTRRTWFNDHFYYCLPLVIGNQYGFLIKATRGFTAYWPGGNAEVRLCFYDTTDQRQVYTSHFKSGVITIQNRFALKTPPGINLMTIQPPNMYIPNLVCMTGVIETDNIRRDFTFNMRVMIPEVPVTVKPGDPLGAFIPIPRGTVEKYEIKLVTDVFSVEHHQLEVGEGKALSMERGGVDASKPHNAGRRYFKGEHTTGEKYVEHQRVLKVNRPDHSHQTETSSDAQPSSEDVGHAYEGDVPGEDDSASFPPLSH